MCPPDILSPHAVHLSVTLIISQLGFNNHKLFVTVLTLSNLYNKLDLSVICVLQTSSVPMLYTPSSV